MSSHDYKGHTIRVDQLPGQRPWAVWVDGELVMGSGERVRRRLAYSTAAAALSAGKHHVRTLVRLDAREMDLCRCGHLGAMHSGIRVGEYGARINVGAALGDCALCMCRGFEGAKADAQVPAQQHEEQQHKEHEAERVADAVTDGRAEQRQEEPQHQDEHQEVDQGHGAKPTPATHAQRPCVCGHGGDVHFFYETNLSYACGASGCECLAFREAAP